MLKVSTRSRYGLRAMVELCPTYEGEPLEMSVIAERQELSRKYLHNLLTELKKAGLVESIRGVNGGFRLIKDPATITIYSIVDVLEGELAIVSCVGSKGNCKRINECSTVPLWSKINSTISDLLKSVTLDSLKNGQF